ncbi:iron-containing alcohol dehydrogenase-domain containing protein [Peziza echinospora]|nr:iron-containing alcohol dehydrogenase-domain containing protein [Peziza echinospora]
MPASPALLLARGGSRGQSLRLLRRSISTTPAVRTTVSTSTTTRETLSPSLRATSLLTTIQYTHPPGCPCHQHHKNLTPARQLDAVNLLSRGSQSSSFSSSAPARSNVTSAANEPDTAFELASSSVRFGKGCTEEVGMDVYNILQQQELEQQSSSTATKRVKRVLIVTDPKILTLPVMQTVLQSLEKHCAGANITWDVYSNVNVEPKDYSVREAIDYGRNFGAGNQGEEGDGVDLYVAVGGGSVMDTAKIVNLYGCYPEAGFLDFVNAPLGLGRPIEKKLKPLICIPTTAGTGSETTGTAIFDLVSKNAKTGISHRHLKPTLGLIDPLNTITLPPSISISSGLDVLFHSLESYTAIPYNQRTPRPQNPLLRPAYQGANPISDIFSLHAMKMTVKNLPIIARSTHPDPAKNQFTDAPEVAAAKEEMLLAATLAGIGFGNAGVHLCHGMSYPISGLNPSKYVHPFYPQGNPLIPHGVSVAVTAPAVFEFTAPSNPERHLECARIFGADVTRARNEDAGKILSDAIKGFLGGLGDQPRGLKGLGFERKDIPGLVEGTVPQRRVLQLAPGLELEVGPRQREELENLFENAMTW